MRLKSIIHTPAGKSDIIKKTLNTMRIDNMSKIDNASAYDSGIYDSNIVNVLPYYTEFHAQVMDLVKTMGLNAPEWLDTGCGTGTLALRALSENNSIRFTLADPSAQMRRGVEVFPITIEEHLKLLKECGFTSVNVLWQSYLQAGFWAIK